MLLARIAFVLASCLAAAPLQAVSQEPILPKLDRATQQRLDEGVRRGSEIYAHDQAAWRGTDTLLSKVDQSLLSRSTGWVTERVDAERVRVVFVQESNGVAREFFSAVVRGSSVESTRSYAGNVDAPVLSSRPRSAYEVQRKARAMLNNQICGRPPKIVVLDSVHVDGGFDVYAIVPEMTAAEAVMAGHKRITFGSDGGDGIVHDYSNSCLIEPDGRRAAGLYINIPPNRGDIPNEMHNFTSLNLGMLLVILTSSNGRSWEVSKGIPLLLSEDPGRAIPAE